MEADCSWLNVPPNWSNLIKRRCTRLSQTFDGDKYFWRTLQNCHLQLWRFDCAAKSPNNCIVHHFCPELNLFQLRIVKHLLFLLQEPKDTKDQTHILESHLHWRCFAMSSNSWFSQGLNNNPPLLQVVTVSLCTTPPTTPSTTWLFDLCCKNIDVTPASPSLQWPTTLSEAGVVSPWRTLASSSLVPSLCPDWTGGRVTLAGLSNDLQRRL